MVLVINSLKKKEQFFGSNWQRCEFMTHDPEKSSFSSSKRDAEQIKSDESQVHGRSTPVQVIIL